MSPIRPLISASALAAVLFVSGCAALPRLPDFGAGEKKAAATAEERAGRITMVLTEDKLAANPELAAATIELPAAESIVAWPQAGANAQKVVGHVIAAPEMQIAWRKSVGKGSSNSSALATPPVASETTIYTLDAAQTVHALDINSGTTRWTERLKGISKRDKSGLGGGLALDGDVLIVASGYGHVTAMNSATGAQLWQRKLGAPMTGAPTIKDGRIFVGSNNNETFALALSDGTTIWSDQAISESARVLGSPSPAAVEDFLIAPYSSGEIIAYRATNGRRLWTDAISQAGRFTPISEINDIGSRPVLAAGLVFASSQSGTTIAIDGRSGTRIWSQSIGSAQAPVLVGKVLFVVGNDGRLAALNAANGEAYWVKELRQFEQEEKKKKKISYSGPILASDRVLLVASTGDLLAFSPQTGEQTASLKLGATTFLEPIAAGGKLFVLTDKAQLIAIR
jgi:outer membrane protein assembly factor BamB